MTELPCQDMKSKFLITCFKKGYQSNFFYQEKHISNEKIINKNRFYWKKAGELLHFSYILMNDNSFIRMENSSFSFKIILSILALKYHFLAFGNQKIISFMQHTG